MTISVKNIITATADYFELPAESLTGPGMNRRLSNPRQVAFHIAREITRKSYPEIGDVFNRHYTTVMAGCKRIKARMDFELNQDIKAIVRSAQGIADATAGGVFRSSRAPQPTFTTSRNQAAKSLPA
jgi:chromosomal replication initiation ATPase DnaA